MLDQLVQWDVELFHLINRAHHPWMDELMYLISTKWFWIPAYLFIIYRLIRTYTLRSFFLVVLALGLLITITDQSTSSLLKPTVKRYRPCQEDVKLPFEVKQVHNKCGGKYGFASSHAANFFGLAAFFSMIFRRRSWKLGLFFSAGLVAYSRIYLGVHYPGDVIVGALIGLAVGWGLGAVLIKWLRPQT